MGSSGGSRGMVSISLFVELLRTRPLTLFWSMAALQLVLWTLVPLVFYSAPPGPAAAGAGDRPRIPARHRLRPAAGVLAQPSWPMAPWACSASICCRRSASS